MIRAGLLVLVLAAPAGAEVALASTRCDRTLEVLTDGLSQFGFVTGTATPTAMGCTISNFVLDNSGQYLPDWHIGSVLVEGPALEWLALGVGAPTALKLKFSDLRLVVQTGNPQMDWLFAAQSRPNAIDAELSLAWDAAARELRLEGLSIDFPGENLVQATARVTGVDLSSESAMQMSATSFALTEFDARITMHGLFEWYALITLGQSVLPYEGDMNAAAEQVRANLLAAVRGLPGTSFSDASKDALRALIAELPNPSGELTVSLRADPGIGPARAAGYVLNGVPQSVAEAAPLFQGVTVDVGWSHADAP